MVPGAALLIAAACAFSPTPHHAPIAADRAVRQSLPSVTMRGWQDPYDPRNSPKQIAMKKTAFELEMEEVDKANNQKLVIGSGITLAGIFALTFYYMAGAA